MITPLSLRAALLEKQAGPLASKPGAVSSKPGVLPDAMPYMPRGPVRSPVQRRAQLQPEYPSEYITRTATGVRAAGDNASGGGNPVITTWRDRLPFGLNKRFSPHAYANVTKFMTDQYGGRDNLGREIAKADGYNQQYGIPVHNSRYLNMRRVPVMWGAPAATRSVIPGKPGLIELPPNPRAGMAAWNMPEDMARYNGLAPGVFSGGDVLESLMHEGVHLVESSTYGSRKSELTRDGPRPVPSLLNTYPEHHPHELLPPGAAIQRWLYQTRGSRLESPEQYDDWIKSVGSYSEAQMQEAGMPQEVRRWLRYRNEASRGADGSPERLRYLDGNLRHLIPGLVQHTPSGAGLQKSAGQAFTRALAFESITDEMADKYDFNSRKYYGITADELARYARIIARKMQHNLENGHRKLAGLSIRDVHEAGKVVPRNLSLKRRYSGSYPKGQVEWNGLRISIETPRGHWRIGKKPDGKLWFIKMRDPYGYFQRRAGYDGDSLDVFIGPRLRSPWVFVINQVDPSTGRFDEHKCVIGCSTAEEARRIYLRNYEPGWKGYGGSVRLHVSDFKRWASKAVDGAAEPQSKAAALGTRLGLHFYGQNPGVRL